MSRTLWIMILGLLFTAGAASAQETDTAIRGTIYQTVNVRSEPGARFEIVGQLNVGDVVSVIGRDSEKTEWLLVAASTGVTGWVASFVVLLEGDPFSLPIVGSPSEENPAQGSAVVITAYGRVNVRSGPGMNYDLIGQLDVGDTAPATARSNEDNDWLFIEQEQVQGWVAYFTVQVEGNASELPVRIPEGTGEALVRPETLIMARFNIRLHSDATLESETIEIIPFNQEVTPLARTEDGRWIYVAYEEALGWGAARLFDISDDDLRELPLYEETILAVESTPEADLTPEATLEITAQPALEVTVEAISDAETEVEPTLPPETPAEVTPEPTAAG